MSSTKISNLTAITEVSNTDEFIVTQNSTSKKMTVDQLRTLDSGPISSLGDEATYQWQLAIVTDDTDGPGVNGISIVYSDGTDWRRMADGTILASRPAAASLVISTTAPSVVVA